MPNEITTFDSASNYYGALAICRKDGKHYWSVASYDGYRWKPISKILYLALKRWAPDGYTRELKEGEV